MAELGGFIVSLSTGCSFLTSQVIRSERITMADIEDAITDDRMGPVFSGAKINLELADDLELISRFDQANRATLFFVDIDHAIGGDD